MMLIGGGGDGNGTTGGGSGAVTVWYGAAQHVPDSLFLAISSGNNLITAVFCRASSGLIKILEAEGASASTAGASTSGGPFAASGFYKSTAGQAGDTATSQASPTTFLSGGADAPTDSVTANYGYFVPGNGSGFFQMQPIIVGVGGSAAGRGGIGCGGGADSVGGPGMVLIASW